MQHPQTPATPFQPCFSSHLRVPSSPYLPIAISEFSQTFSRRSLNLNAHGPF
ncbi:hypothetical protein CC79DRAFT_1332781 [Sarocladium strictum]